MKKKTIWIGAAAAAVLVLGGTGVAVAVSDPFDDDQLTGTTLERASKAAIAEVGDGRVTDSEADDNGYEIEVTREDGTRVEVSLDSSFDVLRVDGHDDNSDDNSRDDSGRDDNSSDDSAPLTDDEKLRATEAALAEVAGTVAVVERSDDNDHAFEVDVTRADGTRAEVELDANFVVVRVDDHHDDSGNGNSDDD